MKSKFLSKLDLQNITAFTLPALNTVNNRVGPSLLVCTVQIFFRSKIMKNNSDYSILERFRISLKFALFYMLFVSFIFLLRGVESIISHLGIIFVWSTIFSMFFWTPLGRRLRHFMDKVPVFWTVVAINCVAFEHYVIKNKILRRSE